MPNPEILRYFEYDHLPEPLKSVSRPLGELAKEYDKQLMDSPEKSMGLRKLLEAKDCMVRASLEVYRVEDSGDGVVKVKE
jgi:hypothetical protein